MTTLEAKAILERHHKAAVCQMHKQIGDATQLGIEALKELEELRENLIISPDHLLPSETP